MIIIFLFLILFFIVVIHELGHFWAAKKSGVLVEEFGIGLPPKIFSKKIKGTVYSLNLLPFGAFVKIFGEERGEESEGSFYIQPARKRALIIAAGPFFNIIFAFLIFVLGFSFLGFPSIISEENKAFVKPGTEKVVVVSSVEGMPAQKAGIRSEDVILKINKRPVLSASEVQKIINEEKGKPLNVTIKRGESVITYSLFPQIAENGEARIGVELLDYGYVKYPFWKALEVSFLFIYRAFVLIFGIVFYLFKKLFHAPEVLGAVSGPVGIYFILKSALAEGGRYFLFVLAQISLSLGVINLFPFPALDGFRLLFLGLEKILGRKKISPQVEQLINTIGVLILILFLVIISYSDFLKFIKK